MRPNLDAGGCFPTGRHYPGIAHLLRVVASGLAEEFEALLEVNSLKLVSIDTETTGRDPSTDRIVEVACVLWDNGQMVSSHVWLVNPGRPIPEEAIAVHGIKNEDVADKPSFEAIAPELLKVLEGRLPVAYNAEFDRNFLVAELGRVQLRGETRPPAVRKGVEWIDPLTWARELQKNEKGRSLGEVAERLGIHIEKAHRATDDAIAAIEVLMRFLVDQRVPRTYGAFLQEQKRLARLFAEEHQQYWRK